MTNTGNRVTDRPVRPVNIVPLPHADALKHFCSGEDQVDRHIPDCCTWHEDYRNRTFCAFVPDNSLAVGFYCLGIVTHPSKHLSERLFNVWRQRSHVPFVYLRYIGVHEDYQNHGIGRILLLNAISKTAFAIRNIGVWGIGLNALNTRAADFYDNMGFVETGDRSSSPFMVLPARAILELIPE